MGASKETKEALENTSVVALSSTVILYLPSLSVVTDFFAPFTVTVTPLAGWLFPVDLTVPVTCFVWASKRKGLIAINSSKQIPVVLNILIIKQILVCMVCKQ